MDFQHCPHAFLAGQWHSGTQTFPVFNPADGTQLACVTATSLEDTLSCIDLANSAFKGWRQIPGKQRGKILARWADLLLQNQDELARVLTSEQGKPLAEARGEIAYAASFLDWFAEEARRIRGDILPSPLAGQRIHVQHEPVGVCAAITPWNFPAAMITRKAGAALAAGCTMVVKPASQTPLTALALAALAHEAGVPAGVFSVLPGRADVVGAELARNPLIAKLSFTGSTATGRALMAACAPTLKRLSLELGGNAPLIVFDDADLDAAVDGALIAKFRNAGQTCVCANRIYVQDGIYEAFARRFSERVAALKVAPGLEEGSQIGPLIDTAALAKVQEHIADALANGAELLTGGAPHALGGTFFQPTVLGNVSDAALIAREETFGPVAPLFRFASEGEVVARANASEFGLASYLFSRDLGRVMRVADALESGMVGINTGLISNEVGPFGGVKQSGFGREGSVYGIHDYLQTKYLCISS
ncbi:NAD-dependent succinate-semialdehyde dehydrogenase [Chitinilyticum aquatile]|uniref:NAD-dependent succinate-semialdehyde dehydrogenase n=1 Tax=Chitinilyticum aquatile TaxID=362520 RepID=UPI000402A244|nr:NAD-dependent succinate-semialdehyde dehydrogenase [Chitinilyticum aquatile]